MTTLALDLKLSYINRLLAFNSNLKTHIDEEDPQDAINLVGDLLADYGDIGKVAEVFQEDIADESMRSSVLAAFLLSIRIEHDWFDRFMSEIHDDLNKRHAHQLLAVNEQQIWLINNFIGLVPHRNVGQASFPTLWDNNGNLKHDAEVFLAFHSDKARNEIATLLQQDSTVIQNLVRGMDCMSPVANASVREMLLGDEGVLHLPVDDVKRHLLKHLRSIQDECEARLDSIIHCAICKDRSWQRPAHITNLFGLIKTLPEDQCATLISSFPLKLKAAVSKYPFTDSSAALDMIRDLLGQACDNGLNPLAALAVVIGLEGEPGERIITEAVGAIQNQRHDRMTDESSRASALGALIMTQNTDVLINLDLEGEILLNLYLFTGQNAFKKALRNSRQADTLLAHDLGL
jgi:hypothetical protein